MFEHKFGWCTNLSISAYYVYDTSYPDGTVVVLSSLQEAVFTTNDDVYKGTKYSALMVELNNKMFRVKDEQM